MTHQDRQTLFNRMWLGLKSQGFQKSMDFERDRCAYRGEGGKRCAVGWIMPDDRYSERLEGVSVDAFHSVAYRLGLEDTEDCPVTDSDVEFLRDVQYAHDDTTEDLRQAPADMQRRLREVAREYDLKVPDDMVEMED